MVSTHKTQSREDMLDRLRLDPGTRTLGELLQERQWALDEITRLRNELLLLRQPQREAVQPSNRSLVSAGGSLGDLRLKRLLRLPEVCELAGLGKTTIYQMKAVGAFPKPVRVAAVGVRWRLEDVLAWQRDRETAESVREGD